MPRAAALAQRSRLHDSHQRQPEKPSPSHAAHKRANGQFFTTGNPFVLRPFKRWLAKASLEPGERVLEPFAGAGHIPRLLDQAGLPLAWDAFDLHPSRPVPGQPRAHRRDTLVDFPAGYRLAITNPPYLARNSATRRGLPFPPTTFDDLYKHALAVALARVDFLAAIIPESFLTAGVFLERLDTAISLPWPMFDDTEHPVCLALFSPVPGRPARIYCGDRFLGTLDRLRAAVPRVPEASRLPWRFNDPKGTIGLVAIDDHHGPSLAFVPGARIPAGRIKPSSRTITRISGLPENLPVAASIARANMLLAALRRATHDVVLTPFKGLRSDGRYRRRLDFATARCLLDAAAQKS